MRIKDLGTRPAPGPIRQFLQRVGRGQGPATQVQRRQIPYWQQQGWIREGRRYRGTYQTPFGAFAGEIQQHLGGDIDFWLYMPSTEIRNSEHWTCFQDRGHNWYLVHMARMAKDVSSGIMTIERLITEAYEQ